MVESEPVAPCKPSDLDERAYTPRTSWSSTNVLPRRKVDVELTPEELSGDSPLREREVFLRNANLPAHAEEDTATTTYARVWGEDSFSWIACSAVPLETELPFSVRPTAMYPPHWNAQRSPRLLERGNVAMLNTKGHKPGEVLDTSVGQDSCCVSLLGDMWECYCVFDGHGNCGHWPAVRASQTLPYFLQSESCMSMLRQGEATAALKFAFEKTEEDLEIRSHVEAVDIQNSGCTAACVLRQPGVSVLWVATLGDSRVAVLVPGGVACSSEDHKPSVLGEKSRIHAEGGEVQERVHVDGFVEQRVCARGGTYGGLCVTRSFGDLLMKRCGVTAEPEVVRWSLSDRSDAYLLIASDGVWDFLDGEEASEIVFDALSSGHTCQKAARMLLHTARSRWMDREGEYCDDISLVLVSCASQLPSLQSTRARCCEPPECASGDCSMQ